MVEETKDSITNPAPAVDAPGVLPDVTKASPEIVVAEPVAAAVAKERKPARKALVSKIETDNVEVLANAVETLAAKAETEGSVPTAAEPKPAKVPVPRAAKPAIKARPVQPAVAAPALPAVKPAIKRPFTATPSVNKSVGIEKPAPRKELFAMATTTEMTDKMTAAFKDAQDKAKAALEKSQAAFGDAGEFAKGNVEAMVESTKILATGLQEMTKSYVQESRYALESWTADVKELTTVKSPTEFFEKQSALLRKNFDAAVAASSKNSEAMLKLANEAFQPISTRVSLAVEKVKHAA